MRWSSLPGTLLANAYRPTWWREEALPFLADKAIAAHAAYKRPRGLSIPDADWDTLLILDACRYDMFADHHDFPGRLESRRSRGSSTDEFLPANFDGRTCHDIVYVTANPMYRIEEWTGADLDDCFHAIVDVWETGWNDEFGTVLPETVAEATIDAHEKYPNKRILSHFVQPHHPFIGKAGRRMFSEDDNEKVRAEALDAEIDSENRRNIWDRLDAGEVDPEKVWTAYVENLEVVFPAVQSVLDTVDGRVVVSSDHGNLIEEYAVPFPIRMSGHPVGVHTPRLTKVPWLVVEGDERREIQPEPPADTERVSDSVSDRLAELGYADIE